MVASRKDIRLESSDGCEGAQSSQIVSRMNWGNSTLVAVGKFNDRHDFCNNETMDSGLADHLVPFLNRCWGWNGLSLGKSWVYSGRNRVGWVGTRFVTRLLS